MLLGLSIRLIDMYRMYRKYVQQSAILVVMAPAVTKFFGLYGIVRFRSEECDLGIPRQAKAESAFLPSSGSAWVQDLESRA